MFKVFGVAVALCGTFGMSSMFTQVPQEKGFGQTGRYPLRFTEVSRELVPGNKQPNGACLFEIVLTDKTLPAAAVVQHDPVTCDYILAWGYDSSSRPKPGDPGVDVEMARQIFTARAPHEDGGMFSYKGGPLASTASYSRLAHFGSDR